MSRLRLERREQAPGEEEENVVLAFKPRGISQMLVACLWSHRTGPGEELYSFAAITDEPPPEVAEAGHDRCVIPIMQENVNAWLNPYRTDLAAQYAILDDRERPYYAHRLAAYEYPEYSQASHTKWFAEVRWPRPNSYSLPKH